MQTWKEQIEDGEAQQEGVEQKKAQGEEEGQQQEEGEQKKEEKGQQGKYEPDLDLGKDFPLGEDPSGCLADPPPPSLTPPPPFLFSIGFWLVVCSHHLAHLHLL